MTSVVRLKLREFLDEKSKKYNRKRYTVRELADGANIAHGTAQGVLSSTCTRIDLETINRMCQFAECEPGDIIVREEKGGRMKNKVKPIGQRILIRPITEEMNVNGIIVAKSDTDNCIKGEVLDIGDDNDCPCSVGDTVIVPRFPSEGDSIIQTQYTGDEELRIYRYDKILAVIENA
jgi:co-chaperonin GroES (HSP10)/DNA-binding Xre family transcriptional regulator